MTQVTSQQVETHDRLVARPRRQWRFARGGDGPIGWVLPALLLALWQVASATGMLSANAMPSPWQVVQAAWRLTLSGELERNVGVSFLRAMAGLVVGGGIGFALASPMASPRCPRFSSACAMRSASCG